MKKNKIKWDIPDSKEEVELYSKTFYDQAKKEGFGHWTLHKDTRPNKWDFWLESPNHQFTFVPVDGDHIGLEFSPMTNCYFMEEAFNKVNLPSICFRTFKSAIKRAQRVVEQEWQYIEKTFNLIKKDLKDDK